MKQAAKLLGVIGVAVSMNLMAPTWVLAFDGHGGGGGRGGGFHGGGFGGGRQFGGFGGGFRGGRFRGGYYGGYYGGWGWGGCYPGLAFGFCDVPDYYPCDYYYYPPPAGYAPPPADYDLPAPSGPKVYTLSSPATGPSSTVGPPSATAQQSPTILRGDHVSVGVAEVKAMAKAGLGDNVILSHIRKSQTVYYLTTAEIIDLKKCGVSDRVIDFMINTSSPGR